MATRSMSLRKTAQLWAAPNQLTLLRLCIIPFIVLMNDPVYTGKHTNGWISNVVVVFTIVLACILAIVTIPLQLLGGG